MNSRAVGETFHVSAGATESVDFWILRKESGQKGCYEGDFLVLLNDDERQELIKLLTEVGE